MCGLTGGVLLLQSLLVCSGRALEVFPNLRNVPGMLLLRSLPRRSRGCQLLL